MARRIVLSLLPLRRAASMIVSCSIAFSFSSLFPVVLACLPRAVTPRKHLILKGEQLPHGKSYSGVVHPLSSLDKLASGSMSREATTGGGEDLGFGNAPRA